MSEKQPTTSQETRTESVPSMREFFKEMTAKEAELLNAPEAIEEKYGPNFKLNANKLMAKRREIHDATTARDEFFAQRKEFGGEEVDAAQELVDGLNFKSTADDRIHATKWLQEAKEAMYEKFVKENSAPAEVESIEDEKDSTPFDEQPAKSEPTQEAEKAESAKEEDKTEPAEEGQPGDSRSQNADLVPLAPVKNNAPEVKKDQAPKSADDEPTDEIPAVPVVVETADTTPVEESTTTEAADDQPEEELSRLEKAKLLLERGRAAALLPVQYVHARWTAYLHGLNRQSGETEEAYLERRADREKKFAKRGLAIAGLALVGIAAWKLTQGYETGNAGVHAGPGFPAIPGETPTHPAGGIPSAEHIPTVTGGPQVDHGQGSDTFTAPTFSHEATHAEHGEGWYKTFKEMNIPAGDRAELLKKVGPDLVKSGVAYQDPSLGGYGISKPGHLPQSALDKIWNVYKNLHPER